MLKPYTRMTALILVLITAACSTTPPAAATPTIPASSLAAASSAAAEPAAAAASPVVEFADPVLEEMVRAAMGRPEGGITAAEAGAVTRLDLGNEFQQYVSGGTQIENISGLEYFTSLESLDLSLHAVTDITPLSGLTRLTLLSLGGNPVSDLTPLAGLIGLKVLVLSNCAAQDYGPLANLANLEFLKLDSSTITDLLPLVPLGSLQQLYLANCLVDDYSLLADIYPALKDRDFTLPVTLEELGFSMDEQARQAVYDGDNVKFTINHSVWGASRDGWDTNIIRVTHYLDGNHKLDVGFYGDLDAYVCQLIKDGELLMNYVYEPASDSIQFGQGDRASSEEALLQVIDTVDGEDVLLAPVSMLHSTIRETFNLSAEALYAMPYEPASLHSLGFFPDEVKPLWRYEQREVRDVNIEIHRPEWGENEYDFQFFTSLSDEYRLIITYYGDERNFVVSADDNDLGGAYYEYDPETDEYIDGWCSREDQDVEKYFQDAFNDPGIEDVYLHSLEFMMQYIGDTFGLTFEELIALPTGE